MQAGKFVDLWKGIFFMIASLSLVVLMLMFIFVWQPIWTTGFKDFHTISGAISKLNETAKPSAKVAPLLLTEITKINKSMDHIEATMLTMNEIKDIMTKMGDSMKSLEEINPNIIRVNQSVEYMGQAITGQMNMMNYEVDQMGDKFSPFGMMPFNW